MDHHYSNVTWASWHLKSPATHPLLSASLSLGVRRIQMAVGFPQQMAISWRHRVLLCRWLNPLFRVGQTRRVEESDLYDVLPEDSSKWLHQRLHRYVHIRYMGQLMLCIVLFKSSALIAFLPRSHRGFVISEYGKISARYPPAFANWINLINTDGYAQRLSSCIRMSYACLCKCNVQYLLWCLVHVYVVLCMYMWWWCPNRNLIHCRYRP